MVLLDHMWDDVFGGAQPDHGHGLGRLRRIAAATPLVVKDSEGGKHQGSMSMSASPATPGTPVSPSTPSSARKDDVWRSVFNPGSNSASKHIGSNVFDKPSPNSPTVYDWLYSGETRSKHHESSLNK